MRATAEEVVLARNVAPLLYLQRDEWFRLERAAAILHPDRPIIAYHLLWRDDVHGGWLPFTQPTDHEIVWVGYDSTGSPTDLWTYWHGAILHTSWRGKGAPAVDVQWGKHGSLPRRVNGSDLPVLQRLGIFYAMTWVLAPDIWLGKLARPGPWCFCHGPGRYRQFTERLPLADRIDVVGTTAAPESILDALFGDGYSLKDPWPF